MHRICETCNWWEQDKKISEKISKEGYGRCRAMPPITQIKSRNYMAVWPLTSRQDWCGHWSMKTEEMKGKNESAE